VKNLALLAHITTDEDTVPIERLCRDLGVEDVTTLTGKEINASGAYLVLLNGLILGAHLRPHQVKPFGAFWVFWNTSQFFFPLTWFSFSVLFP
jgi:hypothetical protein